ncbi:hypothetical protein CEW87_07085 [Parazoarcus communis]|uniref:Transposase n=1 Tax=Parazoarcus communis TaxID=41977 RepID=A0A2U8H0F8_9RHOO|nr:hypothetical protein CEW87_07085 [Parazoarcus communis]
MQLQIAPCGYGHHAAKKRNTELLGERGKRDEALIPEIKRIWQANLQVNGVRKLSELASPVLAPSS